MEPIVEHFRGELTLAMTSAGVAAAKQTEILELIATKGAAKERIDFRNLRKPDQWGLSAETKENAAKINATARGLAASARSYYRAILYPIHMYNKIAGTRFHSRKAVLAALETQAGGGNVYEAPGATA